MKTVSTIVAICFPLLVTAQHVSVNGQVRDKNGDSLPLANIILLPDSVSAATDTDGYFSLSATTGPKQFIISYTGYQSIQRTIFLKNDTTINFPMEQKIDQLKEVVIRSNRFSQADWIETTRSSTNTLTPQEISAIPVLGGEADVIKVMQLLPGTVRGIEGSSDLFVRGGAADQNLVLLDDAPIYNTSHLFGFLSVFNPDVLENVESITGGFPAQYGGRLSSILNIETISDVPNRTHASANIGLLASRLFIEQPLVKDKASIWLTGRRTYIDQVVKLVNEELPYFFYDLNGKIIIKPGARDNIQLGFYGGQDVLDIFRDRNNDGDGFLTSYQSGNNSQMLKWERTFRSDWTSRLSFIRTEYKYEILNKFEDNRSVSSSDIEDIGVKFLAQKIFPGKSSVTFGADWTQHQVSPSVFSVSGTFAEIFESSSSAARQAQEVSLHGQYEWSLSSRWMLNTGFRASMAFVQNKTYAIPEPRISARYKMGKNEALKFSYSRMAQYMHRISNSAVTSPTDIWYPVTDSIRPQTSHQVSIAWQRLFGAKKIFVSVES
ncbi:MAG TPA: TonB-dependent receptor, partial [Cyclobacteriaceae bacterium]|nr:TonB-dependent receptor [Cyclobacteriaceae bacterium]